MLFPGKELYKSLPIGVNVKTVNFSSLQELPLNKLEIGNGDFIV